MRGAGCASDCVAVIVLAKRDSMKKLEEISREIMPPLIKSNEFELNQRASRRKCHNRAC